MAKTMKFVTVTHEIYAYDANNVPQGYETAAWAMWRAADRIVNALRDKYGKTTLAPSITTTARGDSDDDKFDYIYLNVPQGEVEYVKSEIHRSVENGGRGWCIEKDCVVGNERDVEYSTITRKLRHGQMLALANPGIKELKIIGVEEWEYDYGLIKARWRDEEDHYGYRKRFYRNCTGLSNKLLISLDRWHNVTKEKIKSKLPKDARIIKDSNQTYADLHYICVDINETNRAALMRIARQNPKVLKFGTVAVPDAEKSDFIKTIYSEMDKKAKAEAK